MSGGITQSEQGAEQLAKASGQLKGTAASIGDDLSKLVQEYPELAKSTTYQTLVGKQQGLTGGLVQTEAGLQPLAKGLAQLVPSVNLLSGGLGQLADGQKQVSGGIQHLVTMGIVEFIFVKLLGFDGLSWTVSFFVFLIIVALGVDHSIFLMARFKEEYRPGRIIEAMGKAMTTTGGVIMSAALIMGGTFAALMFSGVHTLLQLGAGITIGMAIYTTVFMGLIVPSLAVLFGEANWWPFSRRNSSVGENAAHAMDSVTQH